MVGIIMALYKRFYTRPRFAGLNQGIEENHRQLIDRLDKPERKLILLIIDAKNMIAGALSLNSFICGFRLVWQIMT
jgi:hypothetical protein